MFNFLKKQPRTAPELPVGTIRKHFSVTGRVQAVGFRFRARCSAQTLGLTGWVQNEDDGSVTLEAQGPAEQVNQLIFHITAHDDYIRITGLTAAECPLNPWETGFSVRGY